MSIDVSRVSVQVGREEISFETGKLAKQAGGAVVVTQGDTVVLATATAGNIRDVDFLPLTVDVEERMYAAGKIPGSFFKREGRAGEKGTLTARMIDRPIRPLFPKGWRRETQLVAIPISIDHVHPYDILAMNGASAALMISDIPVPTPVGAVRVGQDDEGNFVVNPPEETLLDPKLDLVVAGTDEAILMVEAGAKEVSEQEILDALDIAHGEIKKICEAQRELQKQAGKQKAEVEVPTVDPQLLEQVKDKFGDAIKEATSVEDKLDRQDATKRVEEQVLEAFGGQDDADAKQAAQLAFDKLEKETIRQRIAVDKKRPDGRSADEIRPIYIETGTAPRTHGSALFQRGQTQALSVVALGTTREEMRLDTLGLQTQKFYFHHYNFPPFSVGEAGRLGGPKRRDIGHGALAERALVPVVPTVEDFPYTIRVVSDILESNGSSSMASVCGSSLSLMAAGVPIKRPVAGIAMGLIKEGDDYIVLSDIAGVEDHLGDMDFKVAGTSEGVTALQMDIKITGVTFDILRDALEQAKAGRTHILGKMSEIIQTPAEELSQYAPRITSIQIDTDKIGMIIGKGGETIRALSDEFESQIDVSDDGTILVYAQSGTL
ncbi:MAG: polyribonucleotide nucleotidyltransferase, partial [Thermoleophilaceae bacterium]|nr:polyribonucleotide nucleotidyltransferase [Thermoleophilaceae bacterium]